MKETAVSQFQSVHITFPMDMDDCLKFCMAAWQDGGAAVEGLKSLIRVPNLTPSADPEFLTNGLIQQAIDAVKTWIEAQGIPGLKTTVFADPGREPLLLVEIPGTAPDAKHVLTYGHLDKMPHLDPAGWRNGLGPTTPVVEGNKIYGRGTNDDGYNSFCLMTAIRYLHEHGLKYPKITIILESGEESGDTEIKRYLDELKPRIGDVGLIVVLDCEAQDYDTVWCCTSLRGVVNGTLSIHHLATPCHSGMATGLVPSTFRIARMLISRLEDEQTGEIKVKEAHVEIPANRIQQAKDVAAHLGERSHEIVSPLDGCKLLTTDNSQLLINKAWKPGLAVTGCDGIPPIASASNVMRTNTDLKLSLRIPPGVDAEALGKTLKSVLEADPPYGAKVTYDCSAAGNGWCGRDFSPEIDQVITEASMKIFGNKPAYYGEGGSIPLCNKFQELWPEAQTLVTGCAGTDSNPHGYNESLDLPYTGKFTAIVAAILAKLAQ